MKTLETLETIRDNFWGIELDEFEKPEDQNRAYFCFFIVTRQPEAQELDRVMPIVEELGYQNCTFYGAYADAWVNGFMERQEVPEAHSAEEITCFADFSEFANAVDFSASTLSLLPLGFFLVYDDVRTYDAVVHLFNRWNPEQ